MATKTKKATSVCDSCIQAVEDEAGGLGFPLGRSEAAFMAREMGADICDHLCDQVETEGEVPCACACQQVREG